MKDKIFYIKITLTIVLIAYLIHSIGLSKIYQTISTGNASYFFIASLFIPIFVLIKTFKWHLMARYAGAQENFFTSLKAMLIGLGFSIFTPARAGEILRVKYYNSVDKIMLGGLVVVDRLIDLITILFLCIYFLSGQFGVLPLILILFINSILLLLLLQLKYVVYIYKLIPVKYRSDKIYKFFEKLAACSGALSPINIIIFSGISFFNWLIITLQFYFLINMYHSSKFEVALASLPVIQLTNLVPITIAGLGVRENLSVLVMKTYDIPNEVAVLGAFSLYMTDVLIPGIIGLILFVSKRNG